MDDVVAPVKEVEEVEEVEEVDREDEEGGEGDVGDAGTGSLLWWRLLDHVGKECESEGSGILRVCTLSQVPSVRASACAAGCAAFGVLYCCWVTLSHWRVGYVGGHRGGGGHVC